MRLSLAGYEFNRFDIAEAYHMFRVLYQSSPCFLTHLDRDKHGRREATLQEIAGQLERIQFRPAPSLDLDSLSENSRLYLLALCDRFGYAPPEELAAV